MANEDILKQYEDKLPPKIISDVKSALPDKVTKSQLKKIMQSVYEEYMTSLIEPGESVGIISADL